MLTVWCLWEILYASLALASSDTFQMGVGEEKETSNVVTTLAVVPRAAEPPVTSMNNILLTSFENHQQSVELIRIYGGQSFYSCYVLVFGIATKLLLLCIVESLFSPYNSSTLQTNDCKACIASASIQLPSYIFHICIPATHPESLRSTELFPFLLYSRCGYFCSDVRWKTWLGMKMDSFLKFVQLFVETGGGKKKN